MSPARIFDGHRLSVARTMAGFRTRAQFAEAVGVSKSTATNWENGRAPDPERFPAIAAVVNQHLDVLFPRHGAPDLADLRCDAGYPQYEVERIVGSKDAVGEAERGDRRLTEALVTRLSALYEVSEQALRAAQDCSFGSSLPDADHEAPLPTTLAGKMEYLLTRLYPDKQLRPSDAELARKVNEAAGARVVSASAIKDLRTGAVTEASPVVREGLGGAFGVTAFYFQPNQREVVRTIAQGLRVLGHARSGDLLGLATRGLGEGQELSPTMLAFINSMIDDLPEE
ncbi:hypothetical protein SMD44_p10076 (plasmid) [Streptomyces alboflavus]|uniref:HTH cro/C1-type domain-containing protein n=1 Tax=Streptomyces alboflavus TaxID=67267 RepID=A0A291W372_9ACTN|nr:helix-turn-helix transcriptional regulator [Streptomyces alboflavus]ATM24575.1 hypothetical protein SMD44_p10076 [Streptomyces alboflavus]